MSGPAPFTPEQEARIREIVAEERKAREIIVGSCGAFDHFLEPYIRPTSKTPPLDGGRLE